MNNEHRGRVVVPPPVFSKFPLRNFPFHGFQPCNQNLYFANTAVIVVFALIVVFTGWQVYDTKREMKNVSEGVQSVYNAVYNDEGWSVFEGTITNEWVWSQNHPEAYQQYLQDKKQREQGLK